jgi:hypothetical protein
MPTTMAQITIDELLGAVNNALNGCGLASTPTPNTAGADDCSQCPGFCSVYPAIYAIWKWGWEVKPALGAADEEGV